MTSPETTERPDAKAVLADLRALSKRIVAIQRAADRGEFKSMAGAFGLQKLRKDRDRLIRQLPPLRLASVNGELTHG